MMYRPEHPKPQFQRENWINLNGEWDFCYDYGKSGKDRKLFEDSSSFDKKITVPFCPESRLSGIGNTDFTECVWYARDIEVPESWKNGRTILHFGAVDYKAEVWIDGKFVGRHSGGYISFSFDITEFMTEGKGHLVLCATDYNRGNCQPTGKQCQQYQSNRCSYTRTTGIWQTVWLEYVPKTYIQSVKMTPVLDSSSLIVEAKLNAVETDGFELKADVSFEGKHITDCTCRTHGNYAIMDIKIPEPKLWTPETPFLYDIDFTMGEDSVHSYFGMRSISVVDGIFYLNDKPYFQRLVLDQGYYPDGIYTAQSEEELVRDILISKECGFNGARLHQKIYEERFLYNCDKIGYLAWGEHANWGLNQNSDLAYRRFLPEWLAELERDYNHPAIIGWCPFNEAQPDDNGADFIKDTVDLTHAYDKTRPVIEMSGFYHVYGVADLLDTHDYEKDVEIFKKKYEDLANRIPVPMRKETVPGLPTFNSEYGSLWCAIDDSMMWHPEMMTLERALYLYRELTTIMLDCPRMGGFCFTQLIDVEQEMNGLFTYDRVPKFDLKVIHDITSRKAAIETWR